MSFDPVFYILKPANFLPASEYRTWLGRIVRHYTAPHYASVPDDAGNLNHRPLKEEVLMDVHGIVKASKGRTYESKLQGVVEACARRTNATAFDFSTAQIQIFQLQNHEDVFNRFLQLCAGDRAIDRKMRDWAKPFGEPLYMVVGIMIWTDAKFNSSTTSDRELSVKLSAPLNALGNVITTSQLGMPLIPDGVGDISSGVKTADTRDTSTSATQVGDHIFAVEYRVIRRLKHTAFAKFGIDPELPRFPGQRTMADRESLIGEEIAEQREEHENLTLEADDVPWTESLDDATEGSPVDTEQLSGSNVGLSFASNLS